MSEIVIVIIAVVVCYATAWLVAEWLIKPRKLAEGIVYQGPILYHGSHHKCDVIYPKESATAGSAVVFATTSKIDAVIFTVKWTDYDFAMWGCIHNGVYTRYLDEQYPGAFVKLRGVHGYIHVIDTSRSKFTLLSFYKSSVAFGHIRAAHQNQTHGGLGNEYVCENVAYVKSVEHVDVSTFLRNVDSCLQMRTYDQVQKSRNELIANGKYRITITGAICRITSIDDRALELSLRPLCDERKVDLVYLDKITSPQHFTKPTIVVGDIARGDLVFDCSCETIAITDFQQYFKRFDATSKTTMLGYHLYTTARAEQIDNYTQMTLNDFTLYLDKVASTK
jgi:hypothetical protein